MWNLFFFSPSPICSCASLSLYPLSHRVIKTPSMYSHHDLLLCLSTVPVCDCVAHLQQSSCRIMSSSRPNKTHMFPSSVSCHILAVKHRAQSQPLRAGHDSVTSPACPYVPRAHVCVTHPSTPLATSGWVERASCSRHAPKTGTPPHRI